MGCANCPKNIVNQGLVMISESSSPDDMDNVKVFSLKKTKDQMMNYSTKERFEKTSTHQSSGTIRKRSTLSGIFPSTAMLREINQARTDPLSYITKIEYLKQFVKTKNNHCFLFLNSTNHININLKKGIEAFDNCIEFLKEISRQEHKLVPLIMKEELKIPFPINSPEICTNQDYIRNIIQFKTEENRGNFKIIDFHYDICYNNVEVSTLLQIIDDTNSNYQRRKNIFNPHAKYIGISEGTIFDNMRCYYLLFAE